MSSDPASGVVHSPDAGSPPSTGRRDSVTAQFAIGDGGRMDAALDPSLTALAATQHGMLTTAQARALGTSPLVLARQVRDGALVHPCRGLYAVADQVDRGPEEWHGHLCAGAHLLYDDASLTSASAVLAHGIAIWGADLARPDLHRPVDRSVGVKAFRVRPRPATSGRPETVATTLGRADGVSTALVQLTLDHGSVSGTVSCDEAVHRKLVTRDELETAAALVATWPGSSRVRAMLAFLDGRSESVGETRCRIDLVTHGIRVEPQAVVRERDGRVLARVDFLVEGTRVIVEFDGRVKYAAGDPQVLWDEKRREDRLRALGYVVVRTTWADLERPGAVAARVRRAMASAA